MQSSVFLGCKGHSREFPTPLGRATGKLCSKVGCRSIEGAGEVSMNGTEAKSPGSVTMEKGQVV